MNWNRAFLIAIVAVGFGIGVEGCSSATQSSRGSEPVAAVSTVPVNKFCPVDPSSAIDPRVTYVYEGKTYGFCCADCIKEFKKNPAKYAATAK